MRCMGRSRCKRSQPETRSNHASGRRRVRCRLRIDCSPLKTRVYGQFCIETLHESRKRKSSDLFVRISTFTQCAKLGFFFTGPGDSGH